MNENLHNIDRLFKDAIEGHKEVPLLNTWETINESLNKTKTSSIERGYNWLRIASFSLVLILLSLRIHDLRSKFPLSKFSMEVIAGKDERPDRINSEKNKHLPNYAASVPGELQIGKSTIISNPASGTKDEEKQQVNHEKGSVNDNFMNSEFNGPVTGSSQIKPDYFSTNDAGQVISLPADRKILIVNDPGKNTANGSNELTNKRSSRLSAIIFFSPDFPFYRLQNDPPDNQPANDIKNAEKPDLSTTTGIMVDYKINGHWSLESGLSYSNTIILIDPKTIYAEKDNTGSVKYRYNASSGYGYLLPSFSVSPTVGDSLYTFTSTHTLRYLNIPMAVKYNIQKGKFILFASAGVSTNVLLQGIIETLVQDNSNNEIEVMNHLHGLKKIYFSGSASIGAEYKLNKNFSLLISPTRRFAINSINKNVAVKSYPNSVGIVTGIRFQF